MSIYKKIFHRGITTHRGYNTGTNEILWSQNGEVRQVY